jgi:hypothetical protein
MNHSQSDTTAAIITSLLLKKGFQTSWLLAIAQVWFCVGNSLLATTPVDQMYWKNVFWAMTIWPLGIDMNFPAATIMRSNPVTKEHPGQGGFARCDSYVLLAVYWARNRGNG